MYSDFLVRWVIRSPITLARMGHQGPEETVGSEHNSGGKVGEPQKRKNHIQCVEGI